MYPNLLTPKQRAAQRLAAAEEAKRQQATADKYAAAAVAEAAAQKRAYYAAQAASVGDSAGALYDALNWRSGAPPGLTAADFLPRMQSARRMRAPMQAGMSGHSMTLLEFELDPDDSVGAIEAMEKSVATAQSIIVGNPTNHRVPLDYDAASVPIPENTTIY